MFRRLFRSMVVTVNKRTLSQSYLSISLLASLVVRLIGHVLCGFYFWSALGLVSLVALPMATTKIHYFPISARSEYAKIVLEYAGAPYEHVNYNFGEHKKLSQDQCPFGNAHARKITLLSDEIL